MDDRASGRKQMIIDEVVRFISSTQFRCGCLELLIACACMMADALAAACMFAELVASDRGACLVPGRVVDKASGRKQMIIDEVVRFISSTQFRCGCLELLIARACMMADALAGACMFVGLVGWVRGACLVPEGG